MKIKKGDFLKSRSGDWHQVLKVSGSDHIQSTTGLSVQSRNEPRASSVIYIFDGLFFNRRSPEEIEKLYVELWSEEERIDSLIREVGRVSEQINRSLWYVNPDKIKTLLQHYNEPPR